MDSLGQALTQFEILDRAGRRAGDRWVEAVFEFLLQHQSPEGLVVSSEGDGGTLIEADQQIESRRVVLQKPAALNGAFFWLSAFYFVYCARPEDWIKILGYLPLAKITSLFALIGLLSSLGQTQRKLRDVPRESWYLLAMIGLLFASAVLSPIWRGGGAEPHSGLCQSVYRLDTHVSANHGLPKAAPHHLRSVRLGRADLCGVAYHRSL